DSIPVLVERFGLKTCAALDFIWEGSWWIGTAYRQKHALEAGTNILAHFLELCGLHSLSDQARAADVGLFAYGGILAVRHRRITEFLEQAKPHLAQIESLTHGDPLYGYMFEKCWMHMFGEPFVRLPPLVNESEADQRGWNVRPVGIQD
ncbi:MAG TPA: hypothetical protein VH328_05905, partial [Burkholderiaceae bacterium]|nr:hypothetical protein [Burkholderiaceae bacterium]